MAYLIVKCWSSSVSQIIVGQNNKSTLVMLSGSSRWSTPVHSAPCDPSVQFGRSWVTNWTLATCISYFTTIVHPNSQPMRIFIAIFELPCGIMKKMFHETKTEFVYILYATNSLHKTQNLDRKRLWLWFTSRIDAYAVCRMRNYILFSPLRILVKTLFHFLCTSVILNYHGEWQFSRDAWVRSV